MSFVEMLTQWRSKCGNLNTSMKAIIILLLWQFGSNFVYFLYLEPSEVFGHSHGLLILLIITLEAGFSILSPLAGLVADVAYGRLRVLKFSTYLIVACTFGVLIMLILLHATEIHIFKYGSMSHVGSKTIQSPVR